MAEWLNVIKWTSRKGLKGSEAVNAPGLIDNDIDSLKRQDQLLWYIFSAKKRF